MEAGNCGEGFASLFRVCAVLPHQACTGGSVFFRRRLSKAGLSESTQHTRLILDPSSRSDLHRSTLGCFPSIYANCKVPLSRQASDRCGVCRRSATSGTNEPSRSNAAGVIVPACRFCQSVYISTKSLGSTIISLALWHSARHQDLEMTFWPCLQPYAHLGPFQ